ncbi:MAG TPA: CPBP family intramembrane glutamic endopeptidase [Rhizomicrobium sp.]|nr:CPBP family intramembrane glutamic endopeptidase [Rhizomicrobium sp.]
MRGERSLPAFLGLLVLLSVPFWLAGAGLGTQLLPGLPFAALQAVCPGAAAVILIARGGGAKGLRDFLARALRPGARAIWWLPAFLLMPLVAVLSYLIVRGPQAALPGIAPGIAPGYAGALFAVFLAGALCEELGWSAYALGPLQRRWSALAAGVVLGIIWAAWHVPPLIEVHRSANWIAWWAIGTVATRVLLVWLFDNTGPGILPAAVMHATDNLSWQLTPVNGSFFDPRIHALILVAVVACIVAIWGPRTLRRAEKPESASSG